MPGYAGCAPVRRPALRRVDRPCTIVACCARHCLRSRSRRKRNRRIRRSCRSASPRCTSETLDSAGSASVSRRGWFAPNTFFNEFTARKLSNARFRGIGSSPNNPGVTTYIDGVPQLNANSSSIEFVDVEQIEFVRGPQSALFGRNALGGVINITQPRPSLTELDRQRDRAVRQLQERRRARFAHRDRSSPTSSRSASALGYTRARRLHRPTTSPATTRLAVGVLRQGAAALDAERTLGSPRPSSAANARATATTG